MAHPHARAGKARKRQRVADHRIRKRQHEVSQMVAVENLTQREIAERLGVAPSTVSKDLAALEREWRAENPGFVDRWKRTLIARANREHRMAEDAFKRSVGVVETSRQEQELDVVRDAAGNVVMDPATGKPRMRATGKGRAYVTREAKAGDSKLLAEMHKRNLEIGRIVGAYPKSVGFFSDPDPEEPGDDAGKAPKEIVIRVGGG